ncbi:alcohol dehydrogenase 1-like [Scleropages formosus]|uniref:Alcohol dehydrogenase 1-like n=1 Tax=Scleropages formosus TaxID=113540 RepID=A0A8C9UYU7_SCLFO|nr:alcohol dehydrogenase 1-like [Scleropages formosus]
MSTSGKVIKCRAAVAWDHNQPLVIEEIEVFPPLDHEVRIKIIATSICHSDLYFFREQSVYLGFPAVLGHEAAGIVESTGPGVTKFKPGDKVIPIFISQCGECRFCLHPESNHCVKNWSSQRPGKRYEVASDTTSRMKCKGQTLLQFLGTSTFSEYTVVSEVALAKIDDSAPLNKVCLLGCCIPTGYGAAVNTAKVKPGSTCAVFGLGAVGLAAVMGCKAAGATRIIVIDINKDKFEKAKVFGATDFVNPKDHARPIQEVLVEMTNGGVDFSLECVGNVDVMRSAFESCVKGWGVSVVVGYNDKDDVCTRPVQFLAGRTWKGCLFGGYKSVEGVPKLLNEYMAKKLKLDELVSHTLPLDRINEGFDLLIQGKSLRTVLEIGKQQ